MERRFQYYVPFTNHTQYRTRARAREHNNTMQKLILNYMRLSLQEHTHLIHVHEHYSYVHTHIYIGDMHTKKVNECALTSERNVFRIANSNVMPRRVDSVSIRILWLRST